jgi:FixJ family two-component response regulator
MPGRPGLEIIDAIRLRGGREPAVLVVSEPSLMVRRGAARRGVTVVEKPFLEHTLIDVIRSAIARPS